MDRLERHAAVSRSLASLDDEALAARVEGATPLHAGIGGTSRRLVLDGTSVFVKRIPLTDLERRPEHVRSTANVFGLPTFCQYGLGGCPGFSAWRELAAHLQATEWVLAGECVHFTMLHHWRVLPSPAAPPMDAAERARLEEDVRAWDGSAAVGARIEAVHDATAHLVLFTEHVPANLLAWTADRFGRGEPATAEALAFLEARLWPTIAFLNAHGLVHFDTHFENVLTDGRTLSVGDFGLASSTSFSLAADEREFLARHQTYDRGRSAVALLHSLTASFLGVDDWKARVDAYRRTGRPELPPVAASAIARVAPAALLFLEFSRQLREVSRRTPYPEDRMRFLLDGAEGPA